MINGRGSLWERLQREFLVSQIMVGDCPRCGSKNTHDCEAPSLALRPPGFQEVAMAELDCGLALELNNVTIGHCDACDYLWCLECRSALTVGQRVCGHWTVCGQCSEEKGYLSIAEVMEKLCASCEQWEDHCLLTDPSECRRAAEYRCPHEVAVSECPRIKRWKLRKTKREHHGIV